MSMTDYSSLEKEIKDAPEPVVLKKGTEVKARIIAVGCACKRGQHAGQAKQYEHKYRYDLILFQDLSPFNNEISKKQRGSLRRRQAGLQRASPDISLLGSLFHRHRLGKVSGHVYITAALPCYIVSKKLQRHDRNKGEELRLGFGCEYDIF